MFQGKQPPATIRTGMKRRVRTASGTVVRGSGGLVSGDKSGHEMAYKKRVRGVLHRGKRLKPNGGTPVSSGPDSKKF